MARALTPDPLFGEIAKALLGPDVDVREVWDVVKVDGSDLHIDSALGAKKKPDPKREAKLAATGLTATGVAALGGLHAVKATRVENAARKAKVAAGDAPDSVTRVARVLKVKPKTAAAALGAGWLALHGVELAGDTLGARAQVKQLKMARQQEPAKVAKGLRLRPLNAGQIRRIPSLKAKRPVAPATVEKADTVDLTWRGEISKLDTERRQVFGWLSVAEINGVEVEDLQNDLLDIEDIELAAYAYVTESRVGGDMHERVAKADTAPRHTMDLIESFVVTPEKLEKMGLAPDALPLAWWGGYQINDEAQWQEYKSGRRTGFSVHGTGRRTPVAKADRPKLRERVEAAAHPPRPKLVPVESSAINAMGYQRQTRRLAVAMRSRPDEPYDYRLGPAKAKEALDAKSKGHHYATQIRGKVPRATRYTAADRARLFLSPPDRDVSKGGVATLVDVAGDTGVAAARLKNLPVADKKSMPPPTPKPLAATKIKPPQPQSQSPPIQVLPMQKQPA